MVKWTCPNCFTENYAAKLYPKAQCGKCRATIKRKDMYMEGFKRYGDIQAKENYERRKK